jgi:hypothetical protein
LVATAGWTSLGGDHAIGNADTLIALDEQRTAHANIYPVKLACRYSSAIDPVRRFEVNGLVVRAGRYRTGRPVARFDCAGVRYDIAAERRAVVERVVARFSAQLTGACGDDG